MLVEDLDVWKKPDNAGVTRFDRRGREAGVSAARHGAAQVALCPPGWPEPANHHDKPARLHSGDVQTLSGRRFQNPDCAGEHVDADRIQYGKESARGTGIGVVRKPADGWGVATIFNFMLVKPASLAIFLSN